VDQIHCDGEIFVDGEDHVILKIDGGIFPEGRVAAMSRGLGARRRMSGGMREGGSAGESGSEMDGWTTSTAKRSVQLHSAPN
jgi:hypothetical protein